MASLSSTSVSSSTSSLGNTSLRGFGGMASGIDRDSIVEQMTLGTRTKIANQQKQYTKLQWKQEAYRSLSDKIIDWQDKYSSYSSSSSLKDAYTFARNVITLHGKEESTQFVKATGTSQFVDNVAITGVKQLATSSVQQSGTHTNGILQTGVTDLDQQRFYSSKLQGATLVFGVETVNSNNENTGYVKTATFTLPSSYTVTENGKEVTKELNYCPVDEHGNIDPQKMQELVDGLNKALEKADLTVGANDKKLHDQFEFAYDNDRLTLKKKDGADEGIKISHHSSALAALGFDEETNGAHGIEIDAFAAGQTKGDFKATAINAPSALDAMTGQKLTFNFDGSKKDIELITADEAKIMKGGAEGIRAALKKSLGDKITDADLDALNKEELQMAYLQNNLQRRLDQAFGKGSVVVGTNGGLNFAAKADSGSTVSITGNDNDLLRNMGLQNGSSNKVNLNGTLNQNKDAFGGMTYNVDDPLDLEINGVKIEGLTGKSTISDILSKINSTADAGVKATYVESTGKFMLVSSETGAGRQITLDSQLAKDLFGTGAQKPDGSDAGFTEGQNAIIDVSYGNGASVTLNRSSNTFDLEGLSVTVSGVFGGEWIEEKDASSNTVTKVWKENASGAVTFSAKADVDGVTEKVKSFIEDFNALVTEINKQVTTRPDSDYEPLTNEQKDEMDETSIENWEKKAKEGILYGDSAIRDLSTDVQSIFVKMMNNGASYEDLKKIGITYSEDYTDGGTLVFDEATFRSAMESDPDLVSNIFTGGGNVSKGMIDTIYDTLSPYATRYASDNNGKSYGSLIDIAGSEKKPTTMMKNQIYEQLKQMQETIDSLKDRLSVEEQRYINQFTTMETLINKFNTQSSYLSQITG